MAELSALKQYWNDIIDAIPDSEVGAINGHLYSKDVYSNRQRDAIDSKQTAYDKLNELLKVTEKKIKSDPAAFDTLLQALRKESAYSGLANKLEQARNKASKSSSDRTVNNGRNKSGSSGRSSNSRGAEAGLMAAGADKATSQLDRIKVEICKSVEIQPDVLPQLAGELRSEKLIIPTVENAVTYVDGRGPYAKAKDLLTPAIEHVRSDSRKYGPALVRALNNVGLESVATKLSSLLPSGIQPHTTEEVDSVSTEDAASTDPQGHRKRRHSSDDQEGKEGGESMKKKAKKGKPKTSKKSTKSSASKASPRQKPGKGRKLRPRRR